VTVCVAPGEIVSFWGDAGPDKWFEQDETFDQVIRLRSLPTYEAAKNSELATWEDSAEGALALVLVLVLDQFPRNLFRGDARAFATDALARAVAERALARGFDQATDLALRPFFYLPFRVIALGILSSAFDHYDTLPLLNAAVMNELRGPWLPHFALAVRRSIGGHRRVE
jgi:uncharacterized protein (DUF924 family)